MGWAKLQKEGGTNLLRKSLIGVIMSAWLALGAHSAIAASAAQISKDSQAALQSLYKKEPKAKQVGGKSVSGFGFPEYPIYENLDHYARGWSRFGTISSVL
jgi:hypothetical protein